MYIALGFDVFFWGGREMDREHFFSAPPAHGFGRAMVSRLSMGENRIPLAVELHWYSSTVIASFRHKKVS